MQGQNMVLQKHIFKNRILVCTTLSWYFVGKQTGRAGFPSCYRQTVTTIIWYGPYTSQYTVVFNYKSPYYPHLNLYGQFVQYFV